MTNFRMPGVICQIKRWYKEALDDGNLARMRSSLPSVSQLNCRKHHVKLSPRATAYTSTLSLVGQRKEIK